MSSARRSGCKLPPTPPHHSLLLLQGCNHVGSVLLRQHQSSIHLSRGTHCCQSRCGLGAQAYHDRCPRFLAGRGETSPSRLLCRRASSDSPAPPLPSEFEVAVIANLHAHVAGALNIQALVSVVLDPVSTHYTRWRDQVLLTVQRYTLNDHVVTNATPHLLMSWHRMNIVMLSWILAPSLLSFRMSSASGGTPAR
jgi:hypothetical protein